MLTHKGPFFALTIFAKLFAGPLLIVWLVGMAQMIRGYTITNDAILVHRFLWDTRLPRKGLISVTSEPMTWKSVFQWKGNEDKFWSKRTFCSRTYCTNWSHIVMLRYTNRTVFVSPDNPDEFVREVMG